MSRAGAQGLAQFMPATARWLPSVAPRTGEPLPLNPSWSIRAMLEYDRWLYQRIPAAPVCDRWAMTLSAYNGGLGWLRRDRALAAEYGLDSSRWEHVKLVNAGRSAASYRENRGYPDRILNRWTVTPPDEDVMELDFSDLVSDSPQPPAAAKQEDLSIPDLEAMLSQVENHKNPQPAPENEDDIQLDFSNLPSPDSPEK